MVFTVSRPCRARNISSRNVSGVAQVPGGDALFECPDVLGEGGGVVPEPAGERGHQRVGQLVGLGDPQPPVSRRCSTAVTSTIAAAGSTAGFSGPCTVTRYRGPMNWSSST